MTDWRAWRKARQERDAEIGGRRQWVLSDAALRQALERPTMLPPAPPWSPALAVPSRDAVLSYYTRRARGTVALQRLRRAVELAREQPFPLTRRVPVLGADLGKDVTS